MSEESGQGGPAAASASMSGAAQAPDTGNAEVDAVLARMSELETLATPAHVDIFESVYRQLQQTLSTLDEG